VSANLVATQPVGENNLLDIYGGAAAAYSLRRLSKNATNVVRVRRSSDNTEANFTAEQILDGDLLRWVGLSASDDGFVTTYYDQSGNGNNAVENTASQQPQLVSGGSVITSNGYTVIQYDGTDDNLTTSLTATGTMLMGGSDGSDFYEVAISGSYSLLASASLTGHPLNESIRVIWGSSLTAAQKTAIENLITYTDWDFSDVTSFTNYWRQRSELTDFPLIDISSGISFINAWRDCLSLTLFPLLNVSSGTSFQQAWRDCSSLTSFPLLNVSSGTNFQQAWQQCSSLEDFPANMFDSVTATDFTQAFQNTNLSSQSIENIVVSIDTAGQSNGTLNIAGGGNATTATAQTAIDSLTAKGWTVTVPDGYVSPYVIDLYQGSAAAYSLRKLSYNTTDVIRVRRSSDNAEDDFTADEITDGTLLSWVGNTASDNGFVTTWYDQAGSNSATQGSAASQPKIVDAGVLVEENGRPAVDFDGTDDYFSITIISQTSEFSHFVTSKGTGFLYGKSSGGANYLRYTGTIRISINSTSLIEYTNVDNLQTQTSFIRSNTDLTTIYYNSNTGAFSTISGDFDSDSIGAYNLGTLFWNGNIQEHIIYSTDQSANRVGIETNINNHYNIYP
jgi:hypothetical protein